MEAIKREVASNSASVALNNVSASAGGILIAHKPGQLPRSKQQLYDLKNKMKKADQVNKLLQYARHLKNKNQSYLNTMMSWRICGYFPSPI